MTNGPNDTNCNLITTRTSSCVKVMSSQASINHSVYMEISLVPFPFWGWVFLVPGPLKGDMFNGLVCPKGGYVQGVVMSRGESMCRERVGMCRERWVCPVRTWDQGWVPTPCY